MTRVRDLLRRKDERVVTIEPEATVGEAVHRLRRHGIGGLPVVGAGGRLVGFVAERDVVDAVDRMGGDALARSITSIMQSAPVCAADDPLLEVMGRMTRQRMRHLVVVEEGRPMGIVSIGDLVKHRLFELETEVGVLRDYVAAHRSVG